ncbi:MAG: DsbA family protein [Sphingomonas sp.]|nr:DsbA family protein [Sphingomonas sp.]
MNRPTSAAFIAAIIFGTAAHAVPPTKSSAKPTVRAAAATAAKVPDAQRDWTKVATNTPAGNVILGNPRARVKVIEYLSFTCSHCAAFSVESGPVLKEQFIRSGSVSIEYRPIGRDLPDLGATILARCAGGLGFANAAEEIFARQPEWLSLAMGFMERDAKRFVLDTPLGQIRAATQASGLIDLMLARGLSRERIDACFADKKLLGSILANGDAARKVITGTPAIVINGTMVKELTWAGVEPLLRAGGAR